MANKTIKCSAVILLVVVMLILSSCAARIEDVSIQFLTHNVLEPRPQLRQFEHPAFTDVFLTIRIRIETNKNSPSFYSARISISDADNINITYLGEIEPVGTSRTNEAYIYDFSIIGARDSEWVEFHVRFQSHGEGTVLARVSLDDRIPVAHNRFTTIDMIWPGGGLSPP